MGPKVSTPLLLETWEAHPTLSLLSDNERRGNRPLDTASSPAWTRFRESFKDRTGAAGRGCPRGGDRQSQCHEKSWESFFFASKKNICKIRSDYWAPKIREDINCCEVVSVRAWFPNSPDTSFDLMYFVGVLWFQFKLWYKNNNNHTKQNFRWGAR